MTTIVASQSIDMLHPYIWYGELTSYDSSHITISDGNGNYGTYYGYFAFTQYGIAGGTLTGYESYHNYVLNSTASGGNFNAVTVFTLIQNGNATAVMNFVLSGNDQITGSSFNDSLTGSAGNDILIGGAGNDYLSGGIGADTIQYTGLYSNFTVTALYQGVNGALSGYQVKDNAGLEGADTISSDIEYIAFNSGQSVYEISKAVVVVNKSPVGADKAITFTFNSAYSLTTNDFGFSDSDGNSFFSVKINTLPLFGQLKYNGTSITSAQIDAGYEVSFADISSGKLTYVPLTNASGVAYSSFTFQVRDNGGSANGGVDLDPSANVITFNVTATGSSFTGTITNDLINGTPGNDTINGSDGNDTLIGAAGDDKLYGGKGTDIAQYAGSYSNFTITTLYDGKNTSITGYQVKDKTGSEGIDTLDTAIEYLFFDSGNTIYKVNSGSVILSNHLSSGSVSINGTLKVGQTLSATHTLVDLDGLGTIDYQWYSSKDGSTWGAAGSGPSIVVTDSLLGQTLKVTASFTDGIGNQESKTSSVSNTIQSAASLNTITGTFGNDNLKGGSTNDSISAGAGNDLITVTLGTDTIDGGAGIDTIVFSGNYSAYTLSPGSNGTINILSTSLDSNAISNVERFQFKDNWYANDTSANNAAQVIYAAFGKDYVKQFLATGISMADSGMSLNDLCLMVTNNHLVEAISGDSTTKGYVNTIFNNVVGRLPNVLESLSFTSQIDSGSMTKLELLELAAAHSLTITDVDALKIDLIGIPYNPGF
jgi:Ca2+-binding RTX toxin-like protein